MDDQKIKKLLGLVNDPGALSRLAALTAAEESARTVWEKTKKPAGLRAWERADTSLRKFVDELWAQFVPGERVFSTLNSVVRYLQDEGWKVSIPTGHEAKKTGRLPQEKDGSFTQRNADGYAAAWLKRKDGEFSRVASADSELKKWQAALWKVKAQRARGEVVDRETHERDLAARAIVLRDHLQDLAVRLPERVISLVGGNHDRIADLVEMLRAEFFEALGRYDCATPFVVDLGEGWGDDNDDDEN